jgi:hypothetical protein
MVKTVVISGFPGVGKSHAFRKNTDLIVLDSDSSLFSWTSPGVRHPEFPQNYISHIKSNIGNAHIILVSSHKVVRDALRKNKIEYVLVYPDKSLKLEYIDRYVNRGSPEGFLKMIDLNWSDFIEELEAEEYPTKIKLQKGEYLGDVLTSGVYKLYSK